MSEDKSMKKVMTILEDLIEKGTFTTAALEGIQDLKKHAKELEHEVAAREEQNLDLQGRIATLTKAATDSSTSRAVMEARLKVLEDQLCTVVLREKQADLLDHTVKCEKEKTALVLDMFKTVFKPSSVRETVLGTIPIATEGHPGEPTLNVYPCPGTVQPGPVSTVKTSEKE
jgi:hypothetical protein